MNNKITTLIFSTLILSSGSVLSQDLRTMSVNQYDCSVDEVGSYIQQKTTSLSKPTATSTWQEMKDEKIPTSSSAKAGGASQPGEKGGNGEEGCDWFNIDISPPTVDFSKILKDVLSKSSDISGEAVQTLKDMIESQKDILSNLSTGLCEKVGQEALLDRASDISDDYINSRTGYNIDDIMSSDFGNELGNDTLKDKMGSRDGELLNIFDKRLDRDRDRAINRTTDKQLDDLEDILFE